ncbi:uronyl 2-sulfotransferase homolog pip-like [Panulirus ornatus]|uniref:uronyl 2-sulfotransferase homolog pip-like n=1 Tax=Panulirus ornatus TaxID=150431 RepID=UPI003A8A22EB
MKLRNLRMSDVVAAVFLPATLVMYVHLLLLTPAPPHLSPAPQASQDYTGFHEQRQGRKPQPPLSAVAQAGPESSLTLEGRGNLQLGPPINVTGDGRQDVLLVTPILRCGSTTMRNLLRILAPINHFTMVANPPTKSEVVHIPHIPTHRDIVGNISNIKRPTAMMQSFAYINFTKFEKKKPIMISLVRDPVERAISWYYHMRAPFQLVELHNRFPETRFPTRMFLKKDLETCLKNRRDPECRYIPGKEVLGHTIEFFCGHESYCPLFGDLEGLQQAKAVVEKEFAVVGLLEEWDKTLTVLEHYVPRFFKGATRKYYENIHENKIRRNENFYKPRVEQQARDYLKRNFTIEYEFYDFLHQRLNQQYWAVTKASSSQST